MSIPNFNKFIEESGRRCLPLANSELLGQWTDIALCHHVWANLLTTQLEDTLPELVYEAFPTTYF